MPAQISMPSTKRVFSRTLVVLVALAAGSALVLPARAAKRPPAAEDPAEANAPADAPAEDVTTNLIRRLVERGVLTTKDSDELLLMAEADAAEARAQKALL